MRIALVIGAAIALAIPALAATNNGTMQSHAVAAPLPSALPTIPPPMAAKYVGLITHLRPSAASWASQEAQRIAGQPVNLQQLESAISAHFAPSIGGTGIPPGMDIEALAFIVLMQATQDQDKDLQSIMDGVQEINKQKAALRSQMQALNQLEANNAKSSPGPSPSPSSGALKSRLDSLNELSETQSLQLQMTMDRRSKLIDTLSNVMKSIANTSDAVVQNLK